MSTRWTELLPATKNKQIVDGYGRARDVATRTFLYNSSIARCKIQVVRGLNSPAETENIILCAADICFFVFSQSESASKLLKLEK